MPTFYFHTFNGEETLDKEGLVLAGPNEAKSQAIRAMGELLSVQALDFLDGPGWAMRVVDEGGDMICRVRFSGSQGQPKKTTPFASVIKRHLGD